jgi:hypothetical protein
MLIYYTAKNYIFDQYLQNFLNLNWLESCILLDPIMLKIQTKKLLTFWLKLKGGEGFSNLGTQFHLGPWPRAFIIFWQNYYV